MACEPGREKHEIEGRLRGLALWIRQHTIQLPPLNPFEPDRVWFGPTATELTILFPGMHRSLADVKLMSRELVAFLRRHVLCVRVGMMHIDAGATAPLIRMRIQTMVLPEHLRRESLSMNYAGLQQLNRYTYEVLHGLRARNPENSGAARTAVQQLVAQFAPNAARADVHEVYGSMGPSFIDDCVTIPEDRDYSRERAAALRACLAAASDELQLRTVRNALEQLGIATGLGPNRPEDAGVRAAHPRFVVACS